MKRYIYLFRELKERLKHVIEENSKLKDCKCENNIDLRIKNEELEATIDELRKELMEKTVEFSEYDEEHRAQNQKMETLLQQLNEMQRINEELKDQLNEKNKDVRYFTLIIYTLIMNFFTKLTPVKFVNK